MELIKINNLLVTIQRQGNNKNGNPIYLLNFFGHCEQSGTYESINCLTKRKTDKHGNIRVSSYNIKDLVNRIIEEEIEA